MPEEKKKKSKSASKAKPDKREEAARVPPHNLDMERALLCSALIDPNGFARVVNVVNDKCFYDRRHNLIFAAMERLFAATAPIDALSVSEELERSKYLEAAGGDAYLVSLSNEVATSTHAEHYANVVYERAVLRDLISAGSRMANEAYETGDAKELIDSAMQELFEIAVGQKEEGFQPIRPILNSLHEHLDKLHHRTGESLTGIGTGFKKLDEMTSGFQDGDFIVIAARPSMGKTAISLDMARYASLRLGVPVAFFSLEMASMAIAMRLIASDARVDLHKLRSGRLPKNDWAKLAEASGRLSEIPFFIDDSGTLGITELRARARLLKQKENISIVFIDYLQLMTPPPAGSREQEVAKISRALKGLARELEVPVVAMSQLSRAVETRGEDARPQLSDLRDSGAIEQDADLVMFIHRKMSRREKSDEDEDQDLDENMAEIIIRKQRNGPTGMIKLAFLKHYASFAELVTETDKEIVDESIYAPVMEKDEDVPF